MFFDTLVSVLPVILDVLAIAAPAILIFLFVLLFDTFIAKTSIEVLTVITLVLVFGLAITWMFATWRPSLEAASMIGCGLMFLWGFSGCIGLLFQFNGPIQNTKRRR